MLRASNIEANGLSFSTQEANGQMRKYAVNDLLLSLECMVGFEFTPLDEGLTQTVEWMRSSAFAEHCRK